MTADTSSILTLRERLVRGEETVPDCIERTIERIRSKDDELGALSEVLETHARERAEELDADRRAGRELGPLFGVPFALKANMCLAGVEAHCGSRLLRGHRPVYTATFLERLQRAGAIPVATAHMDEFAMGSSGENSAFGPTRNPWSRERAPGGSSSGSAAAVAAGLVPFALGSDTGGSVRQPASFCGLSGFKPSYGRISRFGLIAFGSSLDQVSPLARSAQELELLVDVLAGPDARDATSLETQLDDADDVQLAGLRIGVPSEFFPEALEADVAARVRAALDELASHGATLVPLPLVRVPHALATYYVIAAAEASSNLARFDGLRYGDAQAGDGTLTGRMRSTRTRGFGREVKRRILLGTYVLSSGYQEQWYGRAGRVRRALQRDFDDAFETVDVLAGPTSPTPAFRLGERTDPLAMYAADVLTVPASLAGLPAISVPCGQVEREESALPVGLQLIGPAGADARVLRVARAFQEVTDFHREAAP